MVVAVSCGIVGIGAACVEAKLVGLPESRALGERRARVVGIQAEDRVFGDFLQCSSKPQLRLSAEGGDGVAHP